MKLMRSSYKKPLHRTERDRFVRTADDCLIIAALLLLGALAVMTAPRSAADAYRKLQALLQAEAAPEYLMTAGAIGGYVPFSQ